jgi:hypothetical protein
MAYAGHNTPAIWLRWCRMKDRCGAHADGACGASASGEARRGKWDHVGLRETSSSRFADGGHAAWEMQWLGLGERAAED